MIYKSDYYVMIDYALLRNPIKWIFKCHTGDILNVLFWKFFIRRNQINREVRILKNEAFCRFSCHGKSFETRAPKYGRTKSYWVRGRTGYKYQA